MTFEPLNIGMSIHRDIDFSKQTDKESADYPIEYKISDNLIIRKKYNPFSLQITSLDTMDSEEFIARAMGEIPTRIVLNNKSYDVIPAYKLARSRGEDDKYHFIYIQIDISSGEYYVGKVNRKSWREVNRYTGSGVKFKAKYNKHSDSYIRYYIAVCNTSNESEEVEAAIVDDTLLSDPFCLNLVKGGGGVNHNNSSEQKRENQRIYMKEHPEQYKKMMTVAKELYAGDSAALQERNASIKKTMSDDKYKEMSSTRIKNWKENNPEAYAIARENNRLAMQSDESKNKRNKSIAKWKKENPKQYAINKKKALKAAHSEEAERKRSKSLSEWNKAHPEAAKRRSEASARKTSKAVNMLNLETGEVLNTFSSMQEAALWLVENGYARNTNCKSSISAVCLKKHVEGHGVRKQTHGFGWEFA